MKEKPTEPILIAGAWRPAKAVDSYRAVAPATGSGSSPTNVSASLPSRAASMRAAGSLPRRVRPAVSYGWRWAPSTRSCCCQPRLPSGAPRSLRSSRRASQGRRSNYAPSQELCFLSTMRQTRRLCRRRPTASRRSVPRCCSVPRAASNWCRRSTD